MSIMRINSLTCHHMLLAICESKRLKLKAADVRNHPNLEPNCRTPEDCDWSDSDRGDKKYRDFDRNRDRKAGADRRGSDRVRNREGGVNRMSGKSRAR